MNFISKYGWYALLIAIVGDLLIPFLLVPFYKGYSNTLMTISALGNSRSPVRIVFNLWMLLEGILFLTALPVMYQYYNHISRAIIITVTVFITIFAIGTCIITCFFSVNETKEVVTTASKIHDHVMVSLAQAHYINQGIKESNQKYHEMLLEFEIMMKCH